MELQPHTIAMSAMLLYLCNLYLFISNFKSLPATVVVRRKGLTVVRGGFKADDVVKAINKISVTSGHM
jgi:hypothetical protein